MSNIAARKEKTGGKEAEKPLPIGLQKINEGRKNMDRTTFHFSRDRQDREALIRQIGEGKVIKTVVIDKGHPNGPEIHKITDNAIVLIYNQRTGKLITKLIARPGQIKRYYTNGERAPKKVLDIAFEHSTKGYFER